MKTNSKILLAVGIILAAFLIYYQYRFQHFKLASNAMAGSLFRGDILLIDKSYSSFKACDIVVFKSDVLDGLLCSRVVGLPGDTLVIKNSELYINSKYLPNKYALFQYRITSSEELNESLLLKQKKIYFPFASNDGYGNYKAVLDKEMIKYFNEFEAVTNIRKIIHPKGYKYLKSNLSIFPNHKNYNWSRDNFGELVIPKKGNSVELNNVKMPLYINLIKKETDLTLESIKNLKGYTFKKNYYFLMGDNRHKVIDSRYLGFVEESDIRGKYIAKIYSTKN